MAKVGILGQRRIQSYNSVCEVNDIDNAGQLVVNPGSKKLYPDKCAFLYKVPLDVKMAVVDIDFSASGEEVFIMDGSNFFLRTPVVVVPNNFASTGVIRKCLVLGPGQSIYTTVRSPNDITCSVTGIEHV